MNSFSTIFTGLALSLLIHSFLLMGPKEKVHQFHIPNNVNPRVIVSLIKDREIKKTSKEKVAPIKKKRNQNQEIQHSKLNQSFESLIKDYTAPNYPALAIRKRISGNVVLLLSISALGKVDKITITESSQSQLLDKAASDAAKLWTFNVTKEIQLKKKILFKLD